MPHEPHLNLMPPDNSTSIWRYMSLTKLLAILDSGGLYFARADMLQKLDPYEGHLSHVNASCASMFLSMQWETHNKDELAQLGITSKELLHTLQKIKKFHYEETGSKLLRETNFINCWHMSEDESDAMWKLYTGLSEGICIRSTFKRFTESFKKSSEKVFIGQVNYLDYKRDFIDETMMFYQLLSKRLAFRHERELRAIVWRHEDTEGRYFDADGNPTSQDKSARGHAVNKYPERIGINVTVDLEELIEAIYVSPTSEKWFLELVQSTIKKLGFNFPIKQSELALAPPSIKEIK